MGEKLREERCRRAMKHPFKYLKYEIITASAKFSYMQPETRDASKEH